REEHVDPRVTEHAEPEARVAREQPEEHRRGERRNGEREVRSGVRIAARIGLPDASKPLHFSGTRIPNSPVGRNTRTRMRIAKMTPPAHAESKCRPQNERTTPRSMPPTAAP